MLGVLRAALMMSRACVAWLPATSNRQIRKTECANRLMLLFL